MVNLKIIILFTILVNISSLNSVKNGNDEVYKDREIINMTVPEMIYFYNHPVEVHSVTTKDGYILELHRIPNPGKPPILLGHGFASNSGEFVLAGPNHALSFLLFDQGFDVWMMNLRGNRYSRKHITLNPDKDQEFWNFSMHEHGIYDLRAGIDHVLNQTGFPNLSYIGYSLGTTHFFILSSELPEFDQKINLMIGFAPTMVLDNPKGLIFRTMLQNKDILEWILKSFPSSEILSFNKENNLFDTFKPLVIPILNDIFGLEANLFEGDFPDFLAGQSPTGTSTKVLIHICQMSRAGSFQHFDLGPIGNLLHYNSLTPKIYDTNRSTIPKILYFAKNDNIVSVTEIERIKGELSALVEVNLIEDEQFNHLDFLFARNAKDLVYGHVFEVLKSYNEI